jgi:chemotaxis protein methyltransferase CheR
MSTWAAATTRDDYVAFCEGVRALCKVDLFQYKRGQMERRIRTFAGRRGHHGLEDYLAVLSRRPEELTEFLDRMTINVSELWRNPEQWAMLAGDVLPDLAQAGRVRAWSAGCSYGAEAHTLAAVCRDAIPSARVEIKGTDIDARMVERAKRGVFSEADGRNAPRLDLQRWFARTPEGWQAKPELRRMLTFEVGDLLRMRIPPRSLDLILCRNTVIYFTDDARDALHARLADALRPGGYLVIGSTERVAGYREIGLDSTRPFVYRKI